MMFEKRKKGIIAIIALLLAAFIAGGVFSVSAKYTSKLSTANTYVQVGLKLDPNYEGAADSQWRTVSPVNGQAMPSVTPPARDGYIFTGYYSEDGTPGNEQSDANRFYKKDGTSYKNWDASCNVLYAGWEGTFKVTFDAGTNGGTIKDSTEIKTELYAKNGAVTLYTARNAAETTTAPIAEYSDAEHYYFDGWYTAVTGGTKKVNYDGTVLSDWTGLIDDSTVLYAQYKPYTYVVTFDKNAPDGKTVIGTTDNWVREYNAAASALSRNGYTGDDCSFRGWMTSADEPAAQFTDEQSVTVEELLLAGASATADSDRTKKNITLYARWATVHTVTFRNMNSATGSVIATLYEFDGVLYTTAACTVRASIPSATYSGRTKSYWSTQNTGGDIIIDDGSIVANTVYTDSAGKWSLTEDITLYAVWYTVNYYKDTGAITDPEYTELQYIASTNGGKQYIDTGYVPAAISAKYYLKIVFAMRPSMLSNNNTIYKCGDSNAGSNDWLCFEYRNILLTGYRAYFKVASSLNYWATHSLSVGTKYNYTVDHNEGTFRVTGPVEDTETYIKNRRLGNDNMNFMLFRGDVGDYSMERMYYFYMYDGTERIHPARTYVPAVDREGNVGFYDTANDTFTSGTGGFAAEYYTQVFAYGESGNLRPSVVPVSGRTDGKQADGLLSEQEYLGGYYCGYTGKSGSIPTGWTLERGETGVYEIGGSNAPLGDELWTKIEGSAGNMKVDLYTVLNDSDSMISSVSTMFHNMNKNTEYYYRAPAEEETE